MDEFLSYLALIKWGILAASFFALASSFLSPFIILNRNTLLPHVLTHLLLFPLLFLAILWPDGPQSLVLPLAVVLTLLLSLFIWFLKFKVYLFEDTSSSIVIHLSLALVLILAVKSSQYDYRLLTFLFGDVMLVDWQISFLSLVIFLATLLLVYKYKWKLFLSSLGWELPGLNLKVGNLYYLIFLTLQVVIGAKIVGVLLVSAFYVFCGILALKIAPNYRLVFLITPGLNFFSILGGMVLSYLMDIPFSAGTIIFMSLYLVPLFFIPRIRK